MNTIEDLLKSASEMQKKIKEVQNDLKKYKVIGESAGGMVQVIFNVGENKVEKIIIKKEAYDDISILNDLILASVNNALKKSSEKKKDIMPDIPVNLY